MSVQAITSPFDWRRTPSQIDTRDLTTSAALRASSAKKVQNERAAGTDQSTFRGMSKKADASIREQAILANRHGGAYGRAVRKYAVPHGAPLQPDSDTGRLLAALRDGPMTSAQLAAATGVDVKRVGALLAFHERAGRTVKHRDVRPMLFELSRSST